MFLACCPSSGSVFVLLLFVSPQQKGLSPTAAVLSVQRTVSGSRDVRWLAGARGLPRCPRHSSSRLCLSCRVSVSPCARFRVLSASLLQISGACVICGLYSQGALVLANVGDCQAVYHGQVKSAPGSPVTAQTVSFFLSSLIAPNAAAAGCWFRCSSHGIVTGPGSA